MTWTMLTIVINLAGGQPVTIPGYTYKTEAECKAMLYAPINNISPAGDRVYSQVSAVCVPMDFNMQTPDGE
jgi:hypothetical protein